MTIFPSALSSFEPIQELSQLVDSERERIVRLWAKGLRAELHEIDVPIRELRDSLETNISELARLLRDRGEDAVFLWAEVVRAHGARRYQHHFEADDVAREFKVLHKLLLSLYARRKGRMDPEVAELLAELVGEAVAAVEASFSRVLRTEEVRFREAALMESVLHHVDVGILVAESDGTLSYATPPVARLLGLPVRALLGPKAPKLLSAVLAQLNARHPSGQPFSVSDMPFARALKDKRPVRSVMMVIDRRPLAEEAVVEMGATPIWEDDPEGPLWGVIQTMTDRTEAMKKTRELSRAYDELRTLQGRLMQRMRTQALGQLAGSAAHALNNFLNVLRLRITLLRKEFKPDHLDALDRTVRNVGELVSRLQDFTLVRGEEALLDVDVNEVLREALDFAHAELSRPDRPITVETEFAAQQRGKADAITLRELTTNLVLAMRDRMLEGGNLFVRTYDEEKTTTVVLEDRGSPYSPDEVSRLFDPFKGSAAPPHLSLLLGVAKTQIERWGGSLACEPNAAATGMVWTIRLARAHARDEQVVPETPPALVRVRSLHPTRRVLVVDDDPDNGRMLAQVLREEGYDAVVMNSAKAALSIWDSGGYDAALLDAIMPDMSGWDLARELRARSPDVLLAMVTGADVRGQTRGNLSVVDAIFRKPVNVEALDEFLSDEQSERPPAAPIQAH